MDGHISLRAAKRVVGVIALLVVLAGCAVTVNTANDDPDQNTLPNPYPHGYVVQDGDTLTLKAADLLANDTAIEIKNGVHGPTDPPNDVELTLVPSILHVTSLKGGTVTMEYLSHVVGPVDPDLVHYSPPGGYVGADEFTYYACDLVQNASRPENCAQGTVHIAIVSRRTPPTSSGPNDYCRTHLSECVGQSPGGIDTSSSSTTSTTAPATTTTTAPATTTTTAAPLTNFTTVYDNAIPGPGVALTPAPSTFGTYGHGTITYSVQDNLGGGHTLTFDDGAGHTDNFTTAAGPNAGSVTLPVAGTYTIKDGATLLDTITVS